MKYFVFVFFVFYQIFSVLFSSTAVKRYHTNYKKNGQRQDMVELIICSVSIRFHFE